MHQNAEKKKQGYKVKLLFDNADNMSNVKTFDAGFWNCVTVKEIGVSACLVVKLREKPWSSFETGCKGKNPISKDETFQLWYIYVKSYPLHIVSGFI